MRKLLLAFSALALLGACAEVQTLGMTAIEKRRQMNDMQARFTMAATCDIALGSYFRELSEMERRYVALVCGGQFPEPLPTRPAPTPAATPGTAATPAG